jgi:hypothetical protein
MGKPTLKTRKEKKRQDKKGESEGEWMASLSADPANQGIDVPKEADKARFWCKQNRREFTKRFFVNWLLKADRALGSGYQAHTPIPGLPEPHNWKRWLNEKLPDSPLATGGATEAHDWSAIHRATQSSIISRMKEEPLED